MKYKYKFGVLGGTFDRLHIGHKDLLDTAFNQAENITIGLATEKIYSNKFLAHSIEPFKKREDGIIDYLRSKNLHTHLEIIPLNSVYGTTLDDNHFEAIFVTDATLPNAIAINKKRKDKGLNELEIINVPLRKDESGEIISSERIRLGEIDRDGHIYLNIFKNKEKLVLPKGLRSELRHPIGKILTDASEVKLNKPVNSLLISVGDIVTKTLREINCLPDIEIIDFKTRRHKIENGVLRALKKSAGINKFTNEPGTIQKEVVKIYNESIQSVLKNRQSKTIVIGGEEDLLTLPAILLAPLGSIVCYGQFDLNAMIQVTVTEEKKKIIYDLLQKFE